MNDPHVGKTEAAALASDLHAWLATLHPTAPTAPTAAQQQARALAENEKHKGNEALKAGDYADALAYYHASLRLYPQAHVLNNRALCYIKLKRYDDAIQDATASMAKVRAGEVTAQANVKAWLRRGLAYKARGM